MKNVMKKVLALGFGVTRLTQAQADKVVRDLMKRQKISERDAKKLAKDLMTKSKKTQQRVSRLVASAAAEVFKAAGLATKKDLNALKKELRKKK